MRGWTGGSDASPDVEGIETWRCDRPKLALMSDASPDVEGIETGILVLPYVTWWGQMHRPMLRALKPL